jgi:hypothetical protein
MTTGVLTNSQQGATTLGMIDAKPVEMTAVTIDEMSDELSPVRKGGTTDATIDETAGSMVDAISPVIINRTILLSMVTIVAAL